jgi:adenylate cyclase
MTSQGPKTVVNSLEQRTRRAAVLFADMVEYSRRVELDEAGNIAQVARALQLFRALCGDYGGEIANIAGDGVLALFDDANAALRFAMQIQTEFREQSVWADGQPIEFRVGLHIGDVVFRDAVAHGHCINVAARLQSYADPGGILVTGAFRSATHEVPGASLRAVGQRYLRNISEPVQIFAVDQQGARAPVTTQARETPPSEPFHQPSIAVLALTDFSGDPRNDHLCEGFAEDIIANLSRFRNLMVIARHSAFLFKLSDNPVSVVRRELGIQYILSGSLRRSGNRLKISVELIDAPSESVLWSDRFQVGLEDLFDLQDEIVGAVAARLSAQIDIAERRQESYRPRNVHAYGLVLRGQHMILKFTREANWHARRLFEEAAGIVPEYSGTFSALSRTHNLDWRYAWSAKPKESLELAVAFARHATELDRFDARGFSELGYARLYRRQHDEALADYAVALTLNPNDSDIVAEYADALTYVGQPERSIELMQKAMRLNPHFPDWYLWYLADAYDTMGRSEDVIATIQRMHNPSEGQRMLAANYAHLGMMKEAEAAAREVLRIHPSFRVSVWGERPPYKDQTILERFVEGLRKAGLPD